MNLAVKVENDIIALVAVGEVVALDLHRVHEGGAVAGFFPARGNIGLALLRGDAAYVPSAGARRDFPERSLKISRRLSLFLAGRMRSGSSSP